MSNAHSFSVTMKVLKNYSFQIDFGDYGNIISDEPEPLGGGEGPNPVRLLAASVANCLAASLMFAIRKYKEDPGDVSAEISGEYLRKCGEGRKNEMTLRCENGSGSNHSCSMHSIGCCPSIEN